MPTIALSVLTIIVVFGIVKGWGDGRSIIIFQDYDDLGLTFLVPASGMLIMFIFLWAGGNQTVGMLLGCVVSGALLIRLAISTYHINGQNSGKALLAILTKLPLAVVWVLNMIQILNPSGRTSAQRRSNRGQAMVILMILTPIIGALIVDKQGSYFNPSQWLRNRRVGSGIRSHL